MSFLERFFGNRKKIKKVGEAEEKVEQAFENFITTLKGDNPSVSKICAVCNSPNPTEARVCYNCKNVL